MEETKTGKIYEAISAVMADIGAVGKNSKNTQQGFQYRGIDDVMNALNPAMIAHKVFVTPTIIDQKREERRTEKGRLLLYSICTIRFRFYTDDGSYVEATTIGEGMDSGDKATNKAMSIAFKYACFQTFCIPTEEMTEPDAESHEDVSKPEPVGIPMPTAITGLEIANIRAEMERTGIYEKTILNNMGMKTIDELTPALYVAIMTRFRDTPDKKE